MNKIFLLIWKNLIIRKRHWIVTTLEIVLPTLIFIFAAYGYSKVGAQIRTSSTSTPTTDSIFPIRSEYDLKNYFCSYGCTIAYAPDTVQTRQVIDKLKFCLPNRFGNADMEAFKDEKTIEAFVDELENEKSSTRRNTVEAAIIFKDGLGEGGDVKVSYKIRLKSNLISSGQPIFPIIQRPGPDERNSYKYENSGFLGLQLCIDKALLEHLTMKTASQNISLQAFPYPPSKPLNVFESFYYDGIPFLFVLGFVFMVPSISKGILSGKETGIRELLKLNGLRGWIQWLGWLLNSLLILVISVTIVTILLLMDFEGGAIIQYCDPILLWIILMMYVISATTYCFFICSFFTKPSLATSIGILLWFTLFIFPKGVLQNSYYSISVSVKMSFGLLPNTALYLALRVISSFEARATKIKWSNLAEPVSNEDSLSLLHVIFMFLLNTFLYVILTVYLENVLPSEFGVRQPFYYVFLPSTYFPNQVNAKSNKVEDAQVYQDENNNPSFEKGNNSTEPVGVEIKNLCKNFGANKVAVDGVSVKMYDGEIFALLGHNGAGKTTTISMLTGMFAPSSGTAIVNGYDITKSLDKARDSLGLCPQHNMLFDKLTCSEHLRFFGQLKGLSSTAASNETKKFLRKLQLFEKTNTLSKDLSGGQKRKLSLGIALIGGSKVAILDEPTSGMDPEARRAIWDLLLEMRGQRTILLTTHFMEEADVFGDRIGIMADGKLMCCGSTMYLKKFYGAGYTLKMSLSENVKQGTILELVLKYVADASMKTVYSKKSTEMLITLPTETATTSVLSQLFIELTKEKEQLGIQTVGLSLTTMDEVFLRVGEIAVGQELIHASSPPDKVPSSGHDPVSSSNGPSTAASKSSKISSVAPSELKPSDGAEAFKEAVTEDGRKEREKLVGIKLLRGQIVAVIVKKCIYNYQKKKMLGLQLIIPILLLALAMLTVKNSSMSDASAPILPISFNSYSYPVTLASSSDPSISSYFSSVIGSSYKKAPTGKTLSEALLDVATSNLAAYRVNYIVAVEVNTTNIHVMFNTIPHHAAPLAINLASNLLLKSVDPTKDSLISVTSQSLETKKNIYEKEVSNKVDNVFNTVVVFAVILPIGLGMLAASFVIFPIEEKICNAKQLQMMTGISPLTYWYSSFFCDFLLMFVVICLMVTCLPIFEKHGFFTSHGGPVLVFLILIVYGFSAIWFSYLFSLFTSTVAGSFALVSIIHIVFGVVVSLIVTTMELAETGQSESLRWIGRLCPAFGSAISMLNFVQSAIKNVECNANCGELPGVICFTPESYFTWSQFWKELLIMFIMAFVYQAIVVILEYRIIQKRFAVLNVAKFQDNVTDDDVLAEPQRVADMVKNEKVSDDALVVENLCKSFGSFSAVSNLTFGVHHGECFGLLGVNGAGKTTSFRILTGDETASCGTAFAFMKTLEKNRQEFLSNIGYCPQFDGIIDVLSGRQMLELFGRLRGLSGNMGGVEADKWLERMGLHESANVQCGKFSGGMKRRLSVAMAMIGDPPLLLLDEPTSGVDPVSRRQFWEVLSTVRDSGQSIILTSHSMEECEALCSRLGIMVNGQLQCLGGVQHLKNKFAQGYSLSVKLKPTVPLDSPLVTHLKSDISAHLHPCCLKDVHQSVFHFHLENPALEWDVLFNAMEEIKSIFENIIDDYSFNETSLEEVFLAFARGQYGDRIVKESKLKRCLKCKC